MDAQHFGAVGSDGHLEAAIILAEVFLTPEIAHGLPAGQFEAGPFGGDGNRGVSPYISHRLGGTGDPPVPPGHWPGGIRRTINVEKTRLMAGCCFTFRSASRRPGQAGRLSHPRIRQQV